MRFHFKHIVAASMFAMGGLAHAADVIIPSGTVSPFTGFHYDGVLTLNYGADPVMAFDTVRATMSSYAPGTANAVRDTDGFFTQVAQAAPITSMTVDGATGAALSYNSTGGMTITTPVIKSVSTGGSFTLTDLSLDVSHRQVNATIIGANGVGTLSNFHVFDFQNLSTTASEQSCPLTGSCAYPALTAWGLSMTTEGLSKMSQSLGLLTVGRSSFGDPVDFGTITISAVPESSTSMMTGLGLLGLLAARKRRSTRR